MTSSWHTVTERSQLTGFYDTRMEYGPPPNLNCGPEFSYSKAFSLTLKISLYVSSFIVTSMLDGVGADCKLHPASITLGSVSIVISLLDSGYIIYKMKTDKEYAQKLSTCKFWSTTSVAAFNLVFYSTHFGFCK